MTHEPDVENREAAGERTPMLEGTSHQSRSNDKNEDGWTLLGLLQFFGGGIYAPDPSTYDPIEILLNTEDEEQKDNLTLKWKNSKLSELNFVGIVVCTALLGQLE